ncbi:DUF7405 family protein [Streptacidiphilus jiangxiensis]|uniref:Deferrochelatase/peroxidase EfeB n=1 Tax=Streptacidiphilus jiangxiensis TaxID=235985 RepID=A0A1H7IBE6_STRJI|nr:hypothetical protein [Streptacidiphilus jiangxiensis]SEK59664.1 hypothetical protein SAMN05414137_102580 [Streptacidiphilus jiangxiensis]
MADRSSGVTGVGGPSRRQVLYGGGLAAALVALDGWQRQAGVPTRVPGAKPGKPGDVQFDIAAFVPPARTVEGVEVQFGPVHTVFATAQLLRTPTAADQRMLRDALGTVEHRYPFSPAGVFAFVAYGLPYFRRLPGGLTGPLVAAHLPRLAGDPARYVLEEAVPGPTDVSPANPGVTKDRFDVPVVIEDNDLLFTLRSDRADNLRDVLAWFGGSGRLAGRPEPSPALEGLLRFTSSRAMFQQRGLPRKVADANGLVYAFMVNPDSPMWMGFADQQVDASAPAARVTFGGAEPATAVAGDYFDNGSIQHLSHVIMDLQQFYDVDDHGKPGDDAEYRERVQYMFRSTPPPSTGYGDQYTDGGGPAFLANTFRGTGDALRGARGVGTPGGEHRLGHISTLQRTSRDRAGRPLHLRMDGPGFDAMDVPDGSVQPKLQFTAFVPSADFFATMRRSQASVDLARANAVPQSDSGLERFLTATRRQNFLVPPRRHRAFPLIEHT